MAVVVDVSDLLPVRGVYAQSPTEGMPVYQEQYWNEMVEVRSHAYYLELLLEKNQSIDRHLNCFIAITSSSSIASWVIWQNLAFVWASIIAGSHVLGAVRTYLPYATRIKNLKQASKGMNEVLIHAETRWIYISNGSLTEEEIQIERIEVKRKANAVIDKGIGAEPIPTDIKAFKLAEDRTVQYFRRFYPS